MRYLMTAAVTLAPATVAAEADAQETESSSVSRSAPLIGFRRSPPETTRTGSLPQMPARQSAASSTPPASAASQMVWPLSNGHGLPRFRNVTVSASADGSATAGRLIDGQATSRGPVPDSAPSKENRSA